MVASFTRAPTFACDTSYYQPDPDSSYPWAWYMHRAFDGAFTDPKAASSNAWAVAQCRAGKMTGHTAYGVFEPGADMVARFKATIGAHPDPWLTVMIDVESWAGKITGDHSAEINRQAEALAAWLGDRNRVLVYANLPDYAALFPHPDVWLWHIVAGYGSTEPVHAHVIGWQYTDGETRFPVPAHYPRSSRPFGACDHNVFPDHTPAQLAAALGVGTAQPEDDLMALDPKDRAALIADIVTAVWAHEQTPEGQKNPRRMDVAVANGLGRAGEAADAAAAAVAALQTVSQVLGTPKSGVAARVASLQAEVGKLAADLKAVDADVLAAPGKAVEVDADAVAAAVVKAVEGVTFRAVQA